MSMFHVLLNMVILSLILVQNQFFPRACQYATGILIVQLTAIFQRSIPLKHLVQFKVLILCVYQKKLS